MEHCSVYKYCLYTLVGPWASTYTKKWGGGTKSENCREFEKPSFLKPSKPSKVQILGFSFFLFVLQFIVLIKFNFIFE